MMVYLRHSRFNIIWNKLKKASSHDKVSVFQPPINKICVKVLIVKRALQQHLICNEGWRNIPTQKLKVSSNLSIGNVGTDIFVFDRHSTWYWMRGVCTIYKILAMKLSTSIYDFLIPYIALFIIDFDVLCNLYRNKKVKLMHDMIIVFIEPNTKFG
jgi:hypothetical protein